MAAFCAFFPWCDPDTFWDLELAEWSALADVMEAHRRGS